MSEFISLDRAMRERQKDQRAEKRLKSCRAGTNGEDHRPLIRIETGKLEQIVDEAEAALIASGRGLYQRADKIVSVGETKRITADRREITVLRIFERGENALLEDLTAAARFEKWDARSQAFVLTDVPTKVVKVLRERTGRLRFPVLSGVITAPTLRADGSLLDRPGYDAETGLLFDPGRLSFPTITAAPSRSEAEVALDQLNGLICSFPYVGSADRAVALSALLTSLVRWSLQTAPLHGFSAPVAGSGKSKLVDVGSIITTGKAAPVIAQGRTEEETEKRLGSIFLAGDQVVAIDNCDHALGGDFLCMAMTQSTVRIRILGKSESPELPTNAFITATGNNLTFSGDMTRRALLCSLNPKVEHPQLRKFATDPIATARARRPAYVAAGLTILRAYIAAGKPHQVDPLGSFEEWSGLVRSALIWLGEADPVDTMEAARARDPDREKLHAVMSQWAEVIGTDKVTTRNVIDKAIEKNSIVALDFNGKSGGEFKHPDFREALLLVAGEGGAINSRRLGVWLASKIDRMITVDIGGDTSFPATSTRFLTKGGIRSGSPTWILEEDRSRNTSARGEA